MKTISLECPNCSAPLSVPLGEVETGCEYCGSELRLVPGATELEVVRTREEMKRRERVDLQKHVLDQRLRQDEAERWRQMAGRVAMAALPVVGDAAGRAIVRATVRRSGCGCVGMLVALAAAGAALLGLL